MSDTAIRILDLHIRRYERQRIADQDEQVAVNRIIAALRMVRDEMNLARTAEAQK